MKHLVRNVAQHPDAFSLPLAGGRFYPDLVAELADGRLVAEYKGERLVSNDETREKVAVGQLWERVVAGRGVFLLIGREVVGNQPRDQLLKSLQRSR